jgi:hypothetical protein
MKGEQMFWWIVNFFDRSEQAKNIAVGMFGGFVVCGVLCQWAGYVDLAFASILPVMLVFTIGFWAFVIVAIVVCLREFIAWHERCEHESSDHFGCGNGGSSLDHGGDLADCDGIRTKRLLSGNPGSDCCRDGSSGDPAKPGGDAAKPL